MSSLLAVKQHAAAQRKNLAKAQGAAVGSPVRVEPAANDDKPKSEFAIFGDPLFGMAIASVILFVVLAVLIAVG